MKKTLSTILALLLILLVATATGCHDDKPLGDIVVETGKTAQQSDRGNDNNTTNSDNTVNRDVSYPAYTSKDGTWAIYMYICGADLESKGKVGFATEDIKEVLNAKLPSNVNVVMEMGGAKSWKMDMDVTVLNRMQYGSQGAATLQSAPLASMGDPNTLVDFLTFCNTNYPAEHQVVVLWDHGGGSLYGYASDELFKHDGLSLSELSAAFSAAPAASGKYEIVGFDACLMATIDVVNILKDHANYLVASEEVETGIGWYYTDMLNALAADTNQPASKFAQAICDTFYSQLLKLNKLNDKLNMYQESTLSVIDLGKADALLAAYKAMTDEALLQAVDRKEEYLSEFARAARASENYGYNTPDVAFFEMVDMGDLADNAADLLPKSAPMVKAALANCVSYQVKGPLRSKASGVSCFYCYSGREKNVQSYKAIGASKSAMYYHEYATSGKLSAEGLQYVQDLAASQAPVEVLADPAELGLNDFPVYLNNYWQIDIGPERVKSIAAVFNYIIWESAGEDSFQVLWGASDQLVHDWQNGVFTERFDGVWGSIDNTPVHMRPIAAGPGYIVYSSPVLINDVLHTMFVSMEYSSNNREKIYTILGIREVGGDPLDSMNDREKEVAPKDLKQLESGDVVKTVQYFLIRTEDGGWRYDAFDIGETTVGDNPRFFERSLGDGHFKMRFCMIDYAGNEYLSDTGDYKVKQGVVQRVPNLVTYEQPEHSVMGNFIQKKDDSVNPIAHTPYYEGTVERSDRAEAMRKLGMPDPGGGNQVWFDPEIGYGTFGVEFYTNNPDINLDEFIGESDFYMFGWFVDGRVDRQRDLAFEITGIMAGNGEAGKPLCAGYVPGYNESGSYYAGDDIIFTDTDLGYGLRLPAYWEGLYRVYGYRDGSLEFYNKRNSEASGVSGFLFGIRMAEDMSPLEDEYWNCSYLTTINGTNFFLVSPDDIEYIPGGDLEAEYLRMQNDIPAITATLFVID